MTRVQKRLIIIVCFLFLVGALFATLYSFSTTSHVPMACTQEAKQCPDGSYVGRVLPECTFAACPGPTSTQSMGTLQGSMTIGPICPVEQIGHPCNPTPEMYAAHPVFIYSSNKINLIKTLIPDAQGNFTTTLPIGMYVIDVQHQNIGKIGMTTGVPKNITINRERTATVTISIDTGIR